MFGLFTRPSREQKTVEAALANALSQDSYDAAERVFLQTVRADDSALRSLRETCRKTVAELCLKEGIKNAARQAELCNRADLNFDELLRRAASDYLCEARQEARADAPKERELVIEFATF